MIYRHAKWGSLALVVAIGIVATTRGQDRTTRALDAAVAMTKRLPVVFYYETGQPVGVVIPDCSFGFSRPVGVPERLRPFFLYGRQHKPAERAIPDPSPEALKGLEEVTSLEWLIYYGDGIHKLARANERDRFATVLTAMQKLPRLKAIMIYDTTLPLGGLDALLSLRAVERIGVQSCKIQAVPSYVELLICDRPSAELKSTEIKTPMSRKKTVAH